MSETRLSPSSTAPVAGQTTGAGTPESRNPPSKARMPSPSTEEYEDGIRAGDRGMLARAITLVESTRPDHRDQARELLSRILPLTGRSLRVGVTGIPGAGKSTLIDTLGTRLCEDKHRVAVLAVDPSSPVSGGSILGDKTRMSSLLARPEAFVRPSPSSGKLGGVAGKTRESILLCEAAGHDVILVETVGVGQSETAVRSMTDCFLLVMIAGGGDDLQGMKKGIIETADLIAVNKADGTNTAAAEAASAQLGQAIDLMHPSPSGWRTRSTTCSALEPASVAALWKLVEDFHHHAKQSGSFDQRRKQQEADWLRALIVAEMEERFFNNPKVRTLLPSLETAVLEQQIPAATAAARLLAAFDS